MPLARKEKGGKKRVAFLPWLRIDRKKMPAPYYPPHCGAETCDHAGGEKKKKGGRIVFDARIPEAGAKRLPALTPVAGQGYGGDGPRGEDEKKERKERSGHVIHRLGGDRRGKRARAGIGLADE